MSRPVVLLTLLNFVAMGAGFFRETIIAYFFGTTAASDAFSITLFLVEGVSVLAAVGLGTYMIVPVVTGLLASGERGEEYALMETLCLWSTLIFLPLMAATLVWPDVVVNALGPHYTPEQHLLLISLLRWAIPSLPLVMAAGIQAGILQAHADYYSPMVGRTLFSATIAALVVIASARLGIVAAAIGCFAGAVAQLALLSGMLVRRGWRPGVPSWWHRALPQAVRVGLPTLLAFALMNVVLGVAQRYVSSGLPEGSFAAVNYALRIQNLVANLSLALGTVSATEVSRAYHRQDALERTSVLLTRNIETGFFVLTPLCVLFYLYADVICAAVFQRGHFGRSSVMMSAGCLRWFIPAVIPGMVVSILHRALPGLSMAWATVRISAILTAGSVVATVFLISGLQAQAIPAGYLIGNILGAAVSVQVLMRKLNSSFLASTPAYLGKLLVCGAVPVLPMLLVKRLDFFSSVSVGVAAGVLRMIPVSLGYLSLFAILCIFFRDPNLAAILDKAPVLRLRRVLGTPLPLREQDSQPGEGR